jgi:branched-chain amino acid transport system ATP-binding protein
MAADPKLLLLDEPGSGLTRDEKEDLARFILRLRFDWKVSILWIEHDLQMVSDLADRVHVLNIGECIASGTPQEVKRLPVVISAYVGEDPAASLIADA